MTNHPKKTRPRGRRQATSPSLRDVLLQAAEKIYSTEGVHGTTVALVIKEAGVSRPTFYNYFDGCHEIIDEIVGNANKRLRQEIIASISLEKEPLPRAVAAIDAYFGWCSNTGPIVEAIYREIDDPASPASKHRNRIIADFVALLHAESSAFGRPLLDPLLYDTLIRAVEHLGSGVCISKRQGEEKVDRRRLIAQRILLSTLNVSDQTSGIPALSELGIN